MGSIENTDLTISLGVDTSDALKTYGFTAASCSLAPPSLPESSSLTCTETLTQRFHFLKLSIPVSFCCTRNHPATARLEAAVTFIPRFSGQCWGWSPRVLTRESAVSSRPLRWLCSGAQRHWARVSHPPRDWFKRGSCVCSRG